MAGAIRKLILTVEVGEEQGEEVERLMSEAAEKLNGRLTRSIFDPHPEGDGYYLKRSSKTLRKLGRLA